MNKKISSNVSIIILVIILGLSYLYMSLPDNFGVQRGGGDKIPPNCIPMTYRYRYMYYFFLIFMIIFVIRFYIYYSAVSNYKFSDYIKKFLNKYAEDTLAIQAKTIDPIEQENYTELINGLSAKGSYVKFGEAFCTTVAQCSCCNEPGYKHPCCPSNTVGYIAPNTPGYTPCVIGSKTTV
jgi:hypothetical protein